MHNAPHLTPARLSRLFARITTPAAASRASHRVYRLAHRAGLAKDVSARRLYALSDALNEHRLMLLSGFLRDHEAVTVHRGDRDALAQQAMCLVSGGAYGGNHEQLSGFNLWAELHRDMRWYVVDGLDGAGKVLSGPHSSAHQALRDAALMTDTSGT